MSKYGWTLWASIQDGVSDIDFDFWSWGMEKYERAVAEFDSPEFAAPARGSAESGLTGNAPTEASRAEDARAGGRGRRRGWEAPSVSRAPDAEATLAVRRRERRSGAVPGSPGARPRACPAGAAVAHRANRPARSSDRAIMREPGRAGAYVYDVSTGRELFALRADVRRPPASVEKIYTSVAALVRLGATASPADHGSRQRLTVAWARGEATCSSRAAATPTLGSPAFVAVYDQGQGRRSPPWPPSWSRATAYVG